MKTVLRLVHTYFMGTPVTRGLTLSGVALCLLALLAVTYLPQTAHVKCPIAARRSGDCKLAFPPSRYAR